MKIIKTQPQDSQFHLFESLPQRLYTAQQLLFNTSENVNTVFLENAYVLLQNGEAIARMTLYHHPDLFYKDKKAVSIGHYECIDDINAALFLFKAVWEDIKKLNADFIIGPMNGSTWETYRFSIHHDAPNIFLEPYHHLYYNQHFEAFGMEVIGKYFSSKDTDLKHDFPHVLEKTTAFKAQGVTFRTINSNEFEEVLERLYDFNINAFQTNFLYTPISKAAFIKKYAPIKKVIDPDFLIIAEDKNGQLICFFFCVHDFMNTHEKSLIIKTIARHPDPKWRGLGHVTGNIIYKNAVKKGYQSIVHAFMFGDGYSTTISKNFSGTVYKNYALYGRKA